MSVTQPFTLQDTGRETSTIYMHLQLLVSSINTLRKILE